MVASLHERRAGGWSPWIRRGAIGVAALSVLVAGGIAYVLVSDSTTPVGVGDAVDRYRDEQPSSVTSASTTTVPDRTPLPAEGVYVYATDGYDDVDILGGTTHHYPAESTVTIRHTECGLTQRWAPLEERWDEEDLCESDAGRDRRAVRSHHEFFSFSDDQDVRCEPGFVLFPVDPEAGDRWPVTCRSRNSLQSGTIEVVGFETRAVGATAVDTVHVRVTQQITGGDVGSTTGDYWWRTSDGLLVERTTDLVARSDSPVGPATYTEHFTLRLTSLTPRT